mmetsp:Transcript_21869/g.27898  ORF Transcript_21869/g.27898 Transcript_21869/m.27898 type:complete len:1461 (-) Transcript_21869:43-4425(-)
MKQEGKLQTPREPLPPWHKEQNQNFQLMTQSLHPEVSQKIMNTYEYLSAKEKPTKASRDLPNLLTQLVRLTREHFPALHVPRSVSVFDDVIANPYPLCPRSICNERTPLRLHDTNSKAGRRPQVTSCAHLVSNRELGRPIGSPYQRLPSLYSKYQRLITIEGHYGPVYCCAFDKSGKRFFSASDDRTIKIWSVYNGVLLYALRGHEGEITDISVDPFNRYLASASNDPTNQIRIWALEDPYGINIKVLRGDYNTISVVAFNPSTEKKQLLGCDTLGRVCIWNSDNWDENPIVYQSPEQSEITTAVWNHNGTKFATAGGSIISIWTVEEGLIMTLPPPETGTFIIRNLQWCPYYNGLAAGAHDGSVMYWHCDSPGWQNFENWQSTEIMPRTANRVWRDRIEGICMLHFTSDGNYLVSAQVVDSIISVWCTRTKEKLYEYAAHRNHVFTLLPHPSNPRLMITAGYDGLVTIFDVVVGKLIRGYMINVQVADGAFSPSGDNFAFTSLEGTVTFFGIGGEQNYRDTPTSQYFASEGNALVFDSENNIAMDAVLNVPSSRVPREIGDRLGRVYENMPSICLGPVSYEPEPPISLSEEDARYIRRTEVRHEIPDDGSVGENVAALFPIIEPPSPEPQIADNEEPDPSSEEEVVDDDDDDWEGSSRIINEPATAHTLQTRRRTYAATQEFESESESDEDRIDMYETRPRRTTTSQRKYPDWVTAVKPIHNAYIPQVNDEVVYFVEGHEQYMEAYRERGSLIPTAEPFVRCHVEVVEHEAVNYRKYRTKVRFQLRLRVLSDDPENDDGEVYTVCYHPLSKCPDFLILASLFDYCSQKNYYNKRFRMFYPGNEIYYGKVVDVGTQASRFTDSPWESLQVEWENNMLDNDNHISCWEIELLPNQEDCEPPAALDSSPEEDFDSMVEENIGENIGSPKEQETETPMDIEDDQSEALQFHEMLAEMNSSDSSPVNVNTEPMDIQPERRITRSLRERNPQREIEQIEMGEPLTQNEWLRQDEKIDPERASELATAVRNMFQYEATTEFRHPIDLSILPNYYTLILCAIDLSTIAQRVENNFYRREEAIVDDLTLLENNALVFNGAYSWFYKVSCVIRQTLVTFIQNREWQEPDFNIPEEQPEESESEIVDTMEDTPEREIIEDDIEPLSVSPSPTQSPYPLRRGSRSSRPGLRRSARERSAVQSFSEFFDEDDNDDDEAFPRPGDIPSSPKRNYNTRRRASSVQMGRYSDSDSDSDATPPVATPPPRRHQKTLSIDSEVSSRRPRRVPIRLADEISQSTNDNNEDAPSSYPIRSTRRSNPESITKSETFDWSAELSDEESFQEHQEDFLPEPKQRSSGRTHQKRKNQPKRKKSQPRIKRVDVYDSTPEESPDESIYESEEEMKYEAIGDEFEEENSGLRRSGRRRTPRSSSLQKRGSDHPSAPTLASRRSKRSRTNVNYSDFNGSNEEEFDGL